MPLQRELAPSSDRNSLGIGRVSDIASHIRARDILDRAVARRVADIASSDISNALIDAVLVQVPNRGVSIRRRRQGSADDASRVPHFDRGLV